MTQIPDELLTSLSNRYILVDCEQTFLEALQILQTNNGDTSWFVIVDLGDNTFLAARFEDLSQKTRGGSHAMMQVPLRDLGSPLAPVEVVDKQSDLSFVIQKVSESKAKLVAVSLVGVVVGIITVDALAEIGEVLETNLSDREAILADPEKRKKGQQTEEHLAHVSTKKRGVRKGPSALLEKVKDNPLLSILGFLIITLIPTIWFFANELLPAINPKQQVMSGEWNVAVAEFAILGGGEIDREEAKLVGSVFFNRLEAELSDLGNEADLVIQIWGPEDTGVISGKTPEERAANAEDLAYRANIDVIIYGTIQSIGEAFVLQPEFSVSVENFYEVEEVVGQHALGGSIALTGGRDNRPSQINLNRELSSRAQVLALVTRGLSFYLTHAYEDALAFFRQANNDEYWRSNESRQVIYLFLGNAASRASFLEEAEEAYLGALEIAPEYARGYVGLGSIYYLQSLSEATSEDYDLDFELLVRATELFLKALEVEIQQPSADIPSKVAFGLGQIDLVKWLGGKDTLATAVKHFEQVITDYDQGANPRIQELASEAYARLGLVKRQLGDIDGALEQFMTAIELSTFPDRKGLYWATMADLYDQKGDDTKAEEGNHSSIQEYTVALSLTTMPEQLAAYYAFIASRYEALGEMDSAKDALQRAINLLPEGSEDRSIYENRLDTIR